jgi:hypothetical protein
VIVFAIPADSLLDAELAELPSNRKPQSKGQDVLCGYGRCYACEREGKKCGGYKSGPRSMCANCGHNFTEHA